VHRDDLLQLLPQLNPSMTAQHFNQLMDQMFSGFKAGGDMGLMNCTQVHNLARARVLTDGDKLPQCLQAVRLLQMTPKPHLSWDQLQVPSCTQTNERASYLALIPSQAFMKLQMELMREGMTVEMGSTDPDGKNRFISRVCCELYTELSIRSECFYSSLRRCGS
jgi:hypothetical protein